MPKRKMEEQIEDPSAKLNENDKKLLDVAIKNGYLIQKGDKWGKLKSTFYQWCSDNKWPFICIHQDKLTSIIHVDFSTRGLYKRTSDSAYEQFVQIAVRYLDPYGPGDFLLNIRHVPNDDAEKLAQEILELLTEEADQNQISSLFSSEAIVEKALSEKKKWAGVSIKTGQKIRDKNIVFDVRKRARGICELCSLAAPFRDYSGNPYLEVHHIVWISRGGEDSVDNAVALCPNCHRKMHVLDLPKDRAYLIQIAKKQKISGN
jgi:hypothetical protein